MKGNSEVQIIHHTSYIIHHTFSVDDNPFKYSAYYSDVESGNYYLRARYYSPELMRFISRDTFDLSNRYAYSKGNPVMATDRNGHMSNVDIGCMIVFTLMSFLPGIGGIIAGLVQEPVTQALKVGTGEQKQIDYMRIGIGLTAGFLLIAAGAFLLPKILRKCNLIDKSELHGEVYGRICSSPNKVDPLVDDGMCNRMMQFYAEKLQKELGTLAVQSGRNDLTYENLLSLQNEAKELIKFRNSIQEGYDHLQKLDQSKRDYLYAQLLTQTKKLNESTYDFACNLKSVQATFYTNANMDYKPYPLIQERFVWGWDFVRSIKEKLTEGFVKRPILVSRSSR